MATDDMWYLLARRLMGSLQPSEIETLNKLLESDTENRDSVEIILSWWETVETNDEAKVEDSWQKIVTRLQNYENIN